MTERERRGRGRERERERERGAESNSSPAYSTFGGGVCGYGGDPDTPSTSSAPSGPGSTGVYYDLSLSSNTPILAGSPYSVAAPIGKTVPEDVADDEDDKVRTER